MFTLHVPKKKIRPHGANFEWNHHSLVLLWQVLCGSFVLIFILGAWMGYVTYKRHTKPIVVPIEMIARDLTNLDAVGLEAAVLDIKEKEKRFSEYKSKKHEIADPAR